MRSRNERRILKPKGLAMLIWNLRRKDEAPFLAAYKNRRLG